MAPRRDQAHAGPRAWSAAALLALVLLVSSRGAHAQVSSNQPVTFVAGAGTPPKSPPPPDAQSPPPPARTPAPVPAPAPAPAFAPASAFATVAPAPTPARRNTSALSFFTEYNPKASATGGKPYTVCVADNAAPWSICLEYDPATLIPAKPEYVVGFEPQAVTGILSTTWAYGADWVFKCLGSVTDVTNDLMSGNAQCDMGAVGLDVTEEYLRKGLRFAPVPSYYSGLSVVAYGTVSSNGIWFFTKAFTWGVWVAWLVMGLIMVGVIYISEISAAEPPARNKYTKGAKGMYDCMFNTVFMTYDKKGPKNTDSRSYPAKTVAICYCFALMVFFQIYTAQMAGLLAYQQVKTGVTGLNSLQSGEYYTISPRQNYEVLATPPINLQVTRVSWSAEGVSSYYLRLMDQQDNFVPTAQDTALLEARLVGTDIPDALIVDYGQALLYQAEYCNLYIQGKPFLATANAIVFPNTTGYDEIWAFGAALARFQKVTGGFDDVEGKVARYLERGLPIDSAGNVAPYCTNKKFKRTKNDETKITFDEIGGLLVVLGIGLGLGGIYAAYAFYKNREWHRRHFRHLREELGLVKLPPAEKETYDAIETAMPSPKPSAGGEEAGKEARANGNEPADPAAPKA